MTTYTIRTRGLIPVIYKQGPMSGIELDAPILLDLVMRGVDIVDDNTGKVVQVSDIIAPKSKKEQEWEEKGKPPRKESVPQVVPEKPVVTPPIQEIPKPTEPENLKEETDKVPEQLHAAHKPEGVISAPAALPSIGPAATDDSAVTEEEPAEATAPETTATPGVPDKYAGMSRNQRKKAMKRDAEQAAKVAHEPQAGSQTVN